MVLLVPGIFLQDQLSVFPVFSPCHCPITGPDEEWRNALRTEMIAIIGQVLRAEQSGSDIITVAVRSDVEGVLSFGGQFGMTCRIGA